MGDEQDLETRTRLAVAAAISRSPKSPEQIARQISAGGFEISRGTIDNYKNARNTIPLDTAVALAASLRITVDQLAGAAPPPDRSPRLLEVADHLTTWADSQADLAKLMRDAARIVGSHAGPSLGETETG